MDQALESFQSQLREFFAGKLLSTRVSCGQIILDLMPENLISVCTALRNEAQFSFEQLSCISGIDYLVYGQADWETQDTTSSGFSRGVSKGVYQDVEPARPARFASVCHLLSMKHNRRLGVCCYIPGERPRVSSLVDLWPAANWFERESFDLFGILYEGHPDLRRILTDYGFIGHPFRKDFPLEGNVEVRYDPDKKRVIYQPVTIENRVLVPKVIRHDSRYVKDESKT